MLRKADFPAGAAYDSNTYDDSGIQDTLAAQGRDVKALSYLGASYSRRKGSLTVVWLLNVDVERRRPASPTRRRCCGS